MDRRFLISGGGTGGHIYPALAIADELKVRFSNCKILFTGSSSRMEMNKIPKNGYKIKGLWISGFNRKSFFSNFLFPFKLIVSLAQSVKILYKFKPNAVIGTGGFASGPTLFIASLLKIPIFIQEQNSYPGITNKILSKYADKIFVSYENMEKFFPKEKILNYGNPIRDKFGNHDELKKEKFIKRNQINLSNNTLLFLGGSLGSNVINQFVINNSDFFEKNNYNVILQCGERFKNIINENKSSNIKILPFIDQMPTVLSFSDLIISRSGAIIISELSFIGKPVIFIPSTNVAEDHQTKNAKYLYDLEAAELIHENEIDYKLKNVINKILLSQKYRLQLARNFKSLSNLNSTKLIVKEIEKYIK
ncbi:undecaprenyldiphospho-muramoylpentapeptide beta-N-acetylglucosaminyltransferase [Flavobacteriales bacterium]|nr:undecaprenyldiphospho-muramoylpentapeptide beta-N-acetylglucosaminyltransferase [Flavobacteriales bacterium]